MKVIFFYAISRSGHHAVMNWIGYQSPNDPTYILNWHTRFKKLYANGYSKLIPSLDAKEREKYATKMKAPKSMLIKVRIRNYELLHDLMNSNKNYTVIIDCENINPNKFGTMVKMDKETISIINSECEVVHVLLLRDPYNNIASVIKSGISTYRSFNQNTFVDNYLKYIEASEKYDQNKNQIVIYYNQWVTDKEYRKSIAKSLNIPFTDVGFSKVESGSSFDKFEYDGRAKEMDVFNRWKNYKNNEEFRKLIDHECIQNFSLNNFGFYLDFNNPLKEAILKTKIPNQFNKI